ncbi:MAG: hypothetical protein M1817_002740 [Caeruleum heppii]|nr:MAG: hypothetical protein M1817_002740 [Caeruleum heppii]
MTAGVNPNGHDYGAPNLDIVGRAYIIVLVVWTVFVFSGLIWLVLHRHLDFIRMRNITLIALSLIMLHTYFFFVMILYPLNGLFPCQLEFWIMSIHFPLGVALFQAQNIQLLSISCLQRQLMFQHTMRPVKGAKTGFAGLRQRWSNANLVTKTFWGITVCAIGQCIIILAIFLASRKFHDFGITSEPSTPATCRTGWEWIPSIIWQGAWTFGFGPWVLFQIRKIHDIHRWTLQTTLAIVFCLPGLPLWLVALYGTAFTNVNKYWPGAMWFAPGLMMMEFVTIFFPMLEIHQAKRAQRATLEAIESWEKKRHDIESLQSSSTRRLSTRRGSVGDIESQRRADMYNMQALEKALQSNSAEVLEFAATKEFTGENIVFLIRIRDFKEAYARACMTRGTVSLEDRRKLFLHGSDIFTRSICLQSSQFPVNIESKIYFDLEAMFGSKAPPSPGSVVTPFADAWSSNSLHSNAASNSDNKGFISLGTDESPDAMPLCDPLAVPDNFDGTVFDRAERSVKYMVFTNTWVRYVDSLRPSRSSSTTRSAVSR